MHIKCVTGKFYHVKVLAIVALVASLASCIFTSQLATAGVVPSTRQLGTTDELVSASLLAKSDTADPSNDQERRLNAGEGAKTIGEKMPSWFPNVDTISAKLKNLDFAKLSLKLATRGKKIKADFLDSFFFTVWRKLFMLYFRKAENLYELMYTTLVKVMSPEEGLKLANKLRQKVDAAGAKEGWAINLEKAQFNKWVEEEEKTNSESLGYTKSLDEMDKDEGSIEKFKSRYQVYKENFGKAAQVEKEGVGKQNDAKLEETSSRPKPHSPVVPEGGQAIPAKVADTEPQPGAQVSSPNEGSVVDNKANKEPSISIPNDRYVEGKVEDLTEEEAAELTEGTSFVPPKSAYEILSKAGYPLRDQHEFQKTANENAATPDAHSSTLGALAM